MLTPEKYDNFISLHAGFRILSDSSSSVERISLAGKILKQFVLEFGKIYGSHNLCYNIHSLIHLYKECLNLGSLDSFSAYRFESFLGGMKRQIRGGRNPLAQWARRYSETSKLERLKSTSKESVFQHGEKVPFLKSVIPGSNTDSVFFL